MIVWNDSTKQYQESLQINIKIKPRTGNTCVTKATTNNEIIAKIVALGCILKTHTPLPYFLTITPILTSLLKFNNKVKSYYQ